MLSINERKKIKRATDREHYSLKMTWRDWVTVVTMMVIYTIIAVTMLGSTDTPQTYITTNTVGEYFIVDLGQEVEISRINYYIGVKPSGKLNALYYNKDTEEFEQIYIQKNNSKVRIADMDYNVFKIHTADVMDENYEKITTRYIKFVTSKGGLSVGEIGIFVEDSKEPWQNITITENKINEQNGNPSVLFDEQYAMDYTIDFMNSTYFDEIYHGRTGYEHIEGIRPYEWTHPPLGKLLIALGMLIFGKTMFGMRIMGTLFGTLMILLMYLFGKKVTKHSFGGFAAAFLMMFDFMHFTHSRISSIDVYAVTFVILMFYFMYDYYVSRPQNLGLKKSLFFLLFSGFFMGCAMSVKWNTAYGAVGLAVIFFMTLAEQIRDCNVIRRNKLSDEQSWTKNFENDYILRVGIFCVIVFIILPINIYLLTYIPYTKATDGTAYTADGVIELQKSMYDYHSGLTATHYYQSAWYTWPVSGRPLYMYASADNAEGMRGSIVTMGNPAVWWFGIIAVLFSVAMAIQRKDRRIVPVLIAIASLLLPWVAVTRCTFIYHYFPVIPFVIICSAYFLDYLWQNYKSAKIPIIVYFGVVVLLFILFYPVLTGIPVTNTYISNFLRWFPSWEF